MIGHVIGILLPLPVVALESFCFFVLCFPLTDPACDVDSNDPLLVLLMLLLLLPLLSSESSIPMTMRRRNLPNDGSRPPTLRRKKVEKGRKKVEKGRKNGENSDG